MKREIKVSDPLSLDNFRNILDEQSLEWGYLYFKNGWIAREKELLPGLYTVVVNEPNPQEVSYRKNGEALADLFCTCGQKDTICRHIAAVFYQLESV